jgi:hypothetical protein
MKAATLSALLIALCPLVATSTAVAGKPWPPREPSVEPTPAHQLRNPAATWPAEPAAPAPIDEARFTAAYAAMCNLKADAPNVVSIAPKILAAAKKATTDPFTLAALAHYGSRCNPAFKGKKGRNFGLFGMDPGMYRVPGSPAPPVDKNDLTSRRLMDPEVSVSVAATLIEMWNNNHKQLDESFGGGLHRSGAAHFVWGDQVRSSGQEDHILTSRRRMIGHYLGNKDVPRLASYVGLEVVSPLEATPRVAPSGPGDDRSGGKRRHAGLDIVGSIGEPVRAIADGVVIFAGINSPTKARMSGIPPEKIARYRHRRMGVGGIYVCIEHTAEPKRIVSCYMHLDRYNVVEREQVLAGQVIGELGRTGVKVSPPHLHFEVRIGDRHTNPLKTLGDTMIPPKATMTHQYVVRAKRAKRLRA